MKNTSNMTVNKAVTRFYRAVFEESSKEA